LPRCLASLDGVADQVVVVDCFSTDETIRIAEQLGARVIYRAWINYASQFNWALTKLDEDTDWVLRIDADEYLTPSLASEIRESLPGLSAEVDGVFFDRRLIFQGRLIRYGGVFPIRALRLFRFGRGECENRWLNEQINVHGETVNFAGELIDDNLNSLASWTDKHNHYASREAVDLLNLEYGFMPHDSMAILRGSSEAGVKRWLKEKVYAHLPGGFRVFVYFFYRYALRLGFLDGKSGTVFHFLQGFWYRYLVDAKVAEVKRYRHENGCDIETAIEKVLDIQIGRLRNIKAG
jgi:glycosyltransferase involved in cell wall biosynthesis